MREHDRKTGRTGEFIRPRYMVWENVVGAFSSNKGRDFAAVLEEAIRIAEPKAPDIEVPENRWPTWGGYRDVDGRWSVAWRVLDAQYWGVPQRRRRIALVADFGGTTAHEILFNPKGVYGHPAASGEEGERPSASTERGARESGAGIGQKSVFCLQGNGIDRADTAGCNEKGWREDVSYTLNTIDRPAVCAGFKLGNSEQARSIGYAEEQAPTLNAECGGNKPAILDMTHTDAAPLTYRQNGFGDYKKSDTASSCKQRDFKDATDLCTQYGIIRRLTPLECERLQGFPDGWTDIGAWTDTKGQVHKESSDSARYKALGNSIALSEQLERQSRVRRTPDGWILTLQLKRWGLNAAKSGWQRLMAGRAILTRCSMVKSWITIRSFLMVAVSQETRKEDRKKYTTAAARWYLR